MEKQHLFCQSLPGMDNLSWFLFSCLSLFDYSLPKTFYFYIFLVFQSFYWDYLMMVIPLLCTKLCVCFVDRCLSFWPFSFGHYLVCPSIYGFWLPFGIFKLFLNIYIFISIFFQSKFSYQYFFYRAIVHIYHYCHSLVGINTELWHFRYQIVRKFCNHFYFIIISFSMETWIIVKSTLKIGKNYENINYYIH
jgi:hypothetical protein